MSVLACTVLLAKGFLLSLKIPYLIRTKAAMLV